MHFDVAACGKRIKELRTSQHLTQEQLADQLKVYRKHISKIENGYSAGSIDILIDIAEFFDVSMDYLLLGRDPSPEHIRKTIETAIELLQSLNGRFFERTVKRQ